MSLFLLRRSFFCATTDALAHSPAAALRLDLGNEEEKADASGLTDSKRYPLTSASRSSLLALIGFLVFVYLCQDSDVSWNNYHDYRCDCHHSNCLAVCSRCLYMRTDESMSLTPFQRCCLFSSYRHRKRLTPSIGTRLARRRANSCLVRWWKNKLFLYRLRMLEGIHPFIVSCRITSTEYLDAGFQDCGATQTASTRGIYSCVVSPPSIVVARMVPT